MYEKMRPVLERAAAEYFLKDLRQKKGMSFDALALAVWPDQPVASSRMRIHRFLKPQINGKTKNMHLFDFVRFCEVLDANPIEALTRVLIKVSDQTGTEGAQA